MRVGSQGIGADGTGGGEGIGVDAPTSIALSAILKFSGGCVPGYLPHCTSTDYSCMRHSWSAFSLFALLLSYSIRHLMRSNSSFRYTWKYLRASTSRSSIGIRKRVIAAWSIMNSACCMFATAIYSVALTWDYKMESLFPCSNKLAFAALLPCSLDGHWTKSSLEITTTLPLEVP